MEEFRKPAEALVHKLGLPGGFLDELRKSDDWTFVIKTAALNEIVMAEVIIRELGNTEIEDFVGGLTVRQKLKLIKSLNLLQQYEKFLCYISELRNTVAHDIRMTGFSFTDYLADDNNFVRFEQYVLLPTRVEDPRQPKFERSMAVLWAKNLLWLLTVGTLSLAFIHSESAEIERKLSAFYRAKGKNGGPGLGDQALWNSLLGEL